MADAQEQTNPVESANRSPIGATKVIIVSTVMLTFISYWRTAAVVLCDLAGTAYYIGGIVEAQIGPSAPWFILAVMVFSYAVRAVYLESCSLFVRGGVYKVVKEAMGGTSAKLAVSALMFDYILTGPISGVSAGQYLIGLLLDALSLVRPDRNAIPREALKSWGSVVVAILVTLYFFRQNLLGIRESSDKALKIMAATTVMGVIVFIWCGATLLVRGPANSVPWRPDLSKKVEYEVVKGKDRVTGEDTEVWRRDQETGRFVPKFDEKGEPVPRINQITGRQEDPLGFAASIPGADKLRDPEKINWLGVFGMLGLLFAFGHSVLAMSGEETLAQVYREVEAPKMPNFKKAAFIIFVYSFVLTAGISFLAVLLIPDEIRMKDYSDNLIAGLAMHVIGPAPARFALHVLVVVVGFLILAGSVNTAIIGSNGVLNRVAEDGVLPDWFLRPHPQYGTTYRVLYLIVGLQLATILISRGDVLLLGEAYAFGVVWSFIFKAAAMLMLRFQNRSPREFKVPLNLTVDGVEIPIGLTLIFMVLLATGVVNLFSKEVATVSGLAFTAAFVVVFFLSEHYNLRKLGEKKHEFLEQVNNRISPNVSAKELDLSKRYHRLVAVRSPERLETLEKVLAETNSADTDVVVLLAKPTSGPVTPDEPTVDEHDQRLLTAVVERAEKAGKEVKPLVVPTNDRLTATARTAKELGVDEVVLDAHSQSMARARLHKFVEEWTSLCGGPNVPLTIRVLGGPHDVRVDVGGGRHIPPGEGRSTAPAKPLPNQLVRRALIVLSTDEQSELLKTVLDVLGAAVEVDFAVMGEPAKSSENGDWFKADLEHAEKVCRKATLHRLPAIDAEEAILKLMGQCHSELLVLSAENGPSAPFDLDRVVRHSPCPVFVASPPAADDDTTSQDEDD